MPVHPTAIVSSLAEIDPSASIGPYVIIEGSVKVGAGSHVAAAAIILGSTAVGRGCRIHSHAVVGDTPQDRAYQGGDAGETFCRIGDDCIIREGATIHRGTLPGTATVIGDRCMLMTNTHVGHNCEIGDDVVIVSGALLGGHVHVGDKAVIAGGAAIHQFVRIGALAMVSGLAKVVQDVPPYFLTDRDGAIVGENRIGLLRARLTPAERQEIKSAFRIIYRSGQLREVVLNELRSTLTTVAGQTLLDFMVLDSTRGVRRESVPFRRAA
jgi:UDP-N-acetylglucosamine acyltransferase